MTDSKEQQQTATEEGINLEHREGDPLLKTRDLTKRFGSKTVVNQVSYEVYNGEIVGLLGRNGAGKTTSFKMTIGMLEPDRGHVFLGESDVTGEPMYRRAQMGLGYLPQEPSLLMKLSVEDNLRAVVENMALSPQQREEHIEQLLEEFDIADLREQKAATLSGGETRRVEICRAIATDPAVILLDEPFSGVDPIAVSELQELVRSLMQREIGILLTDHNVRETLQVTDRSYIIDEGRILAHGTVDEIVHNDLVRQVYLGEEFEL